MSLAPTATDHIALPARAPRSLRPVHESILSGFLFVAICGAALLWAREAQTSVVWVKLCRLQMWGCIIFPSFLMMHLILPVARWRQTTRLAEIQLTPASSLHVLAREMLPRAFGLTAVWTGVTLLIALFTPTIESGAHTSVIAGAQEHVTVLWLTIPIVLVQTLWIGTLMFAGMLWARDSSGAIVVTVLAGLAFPWFALALVMPSCTLGVNVTLAHVQTQALLVMPLKLMITACLIGWIPLLWARPASE